MTENSDHIQQRNSVFLEEDRPSWWLPQQDQCNSYHTAHQMLHTILVHFSAHYGWHYFDMQCPTQDSLACMSDLH